MAKGPRNIKKLLAEGLDIPEEKKGFLPAGFQRIGHVVILNLRPEISGYAKQIAGLVLDNFTYVKTVCLAEGVSGELRKPTVRWIAGEKRTEAVHTENGCQFTLDVTKVMLSKGNLSERARLPPLVRPGEVVVDMFAGIGYFSIPIARHARPGKVYSIEKSLDSFRYLRENIRLNMVQERVSPTLGDCREVGLEDVADRVLMGYLPGTERFLPAAFRALRPEGGFIHYHDLFHESELWDKPLGILESQAGKAGYSLERVTHKGVVKEHSPRVYHVVVDAAFAGAGKI